MESPPLYGLTLAAGILLSGIWYSFRIKKAGQKISAAMIGLILGILLGYLGAKLVYAAFNWGYQTGTYGIGFLFRTVPEEFSFVGGCIGYCGGVALGAKVGGIRISRALDLFAAPGCLLAAAARFGEIFLGELGLAELSTVGLAEIEEGSLLAFFPAAVQDDWGMWAFAVSTLTALGDLIVCGVTARRGTAAHGKDGRIFERAAFLLCAIQFFLELTRMVSFIFYFVHVEQALCAILMIILTVRICRGTGSEGGRIRKGPVITAAVLTAVNGVTQYLMDKPWKFEKLIPEGILQWINENLAPFCFSVMLLTTVAWTAVYLLSWRKEK